MQSIGTLPGDTAAEARAASADGSVIVGYSGLTSIRGFRWVSGAGMQDLGPGMAIGVNADGSVVVGANASMWTAALGRVDLNAYLPSLGINLTGWTLTTAYGVSSDGQTIVGSGVHNGVVEAWIATLAVTPTCYANCDASTAPPILNVNDFTCFLNRFAAGDTYANCDASTTPPILNVNDFTCFLNRFAAGNSYANCDGSTVPPVLNVADFSCFLNRFAAGCP
jgi:probable HAF family extracellular repeat protein